MIRKEKAIVMIGYKRETAEPLVLAERHRSDERAKRNSSRIGTLGAINGTANPKR
jgi:hypothetical protein